MRARPPYIHHLETLEKLKHLSITNATEDFLPLSRLKNLESLTAVTRSVSSETFSALCHNLLGLKQLTLSKLQENPPCKELEHLQELEELVLFSVRLTDCTSLRDGLRELKKLKTAIVLVDERVPADQEKSLKQEFPFLDIVWNDPANVVNMRKYARIVTTKRENSPYDFTLPKMYFERLVAEEEKLASQ